MQVTYTDPLREIDIPEQWQFAPVLQVKVPFKETHLPPRAQQ
ncbi:Uncharacterised protein [Mycobacterium tuberculosis]|nr:Uncharacterised protein [Mycobacterium tuberculosis]